MKLFCNNINQIYVNIYTIQTNDDNIDLFYHELGNIPKYLLLENKNNTNLYIFCINSDNNFKKLIEKYNYICYNSNYEIKINKNKYNSNYKIKLNYGKNVKEPYCLELK
jgi:hypothetical protein